MNKMRENRLRWLCYVERRFGNSKKSYGIECGRKKRKGKTKEEVVDDD